MACEIKTKKEMQKKIKEKKDSHRKHATRVPFGGYSVKELFR